MINVSPEIYTDLLIASLRSKGVSESDIKFARDELVLAMRCRYAIVYPDKYSVTPEEAKFPADNK